MFSFTTYMMTVASIIGTLCVSTPVDKNNAEKTRLLNVFTEESSQKYYKPVYIDMTNSVKSDEPANTLHSVKRIPIYPK